MRFRFAAALLATLLVVLPLTHSVAEAAEVRAETGVRRVSVGETFTVELTAILDDGDGSAQDPKLPLQGAAEVAGPSLFSQRRIVMHNFDIKTENNVVATYEVTPTGPGRLVLGPGSFVVGGRRLEANALTVEVVDGPPQAPRRSRTLRSPFGFGQDPFDQDPFGRDPSGQGSPGQGSPGRDPAAQDPFDMLRRRSSLSGYPDAPPELVLQSAPNRVGFLVAKLNQTSAVIGEPIVLSIYAYGGRGAFRELSPTEPALADFLSYPSVETSHEQPFFRTEIAGQEFLVVKLREFVLIPLRTGELEIGSMRAILRGRGYPSQGSALGSAATSPPLYLSAREPPALGRPPGYRLGDVGHFDLAGQVSPREIDQNEFFSVRLELRGRGNLPSSLDMPEVPGVVWGDPTVRGEVSVENRVLVGNRVLEFTARASAPGTIELGSVVLPYFDADEGRYQVSSAPLGTIVVNPAASAAAAPAASAAAPSAEPDGRALLLGLAPRATATTFRPSRSAPPLWALLPLAAGPVLVWLLFLLPALFSRLGPELARRRSKKVDVDLSALAALEKSTDRADVAGQLEQLLYRLIEAKTGLRARAILNSHLSARLEQAGLEPDLAGAVQTLLLSLESARFASRTDGGASPPLVESARSVLLRLGKAPSPKAQA